MGCMLYVSLWLIKDVILKDLLLFPATGALSKTLQTPLSAVAAFSVLL